MAASTSLLVRNNGTNAQFRAWGSAISAAFAAGGLVQTADTGQINWTTVTAPVAINTSQGYEIWRSNDATGSLNNWYVKIEYGSGAAAANPSIWLTLGWSSDGAGSINSTNACARTQIATGGTSVASECNFGVGTGYISVCLWGNTGSTDYLIFSIERTRNTLGAVQDEVFVYGGGSGGAVSINQVIPRTGNVPASVTTAGHGWRTIPVAAATYLGNKAVGTLAPQKGSWLMESLNLLAGNSTDFLQQTQFTMTVYGGTHTYIVVGISTTLGLGSTRLLIRYE